MTQLNTEDVEAYIDAVNQLRTQLWALHGALEMLEAFIDRMDRQADRPGDCRCAEAVFATIDDVGMCKACHDRWLAASPHVYEKPGYLMGR